MCRLPGVRRNFETLQLTHGLQQSAFAAQLRLRSDVLPAQQPAHVLRRRDRLDLLAQGGDCEVVNARQQSPVAPLGGSLARCLSPVRVKFPRRTEPDASMRSSACSTSAADRPSQ